MTLLTSIAEPLLATLGVAAVKAALLLLAAGVITRGLRRRSAALRHLVWTLALGATLAVLVLPATLPAWHVVPVPAVFWSSTPWPTRSASRAVTAPTPVAPGPVELEPASPIRSPIAAAAPATPATGLIVAAGARLPAILLILWLTGIGVILARYAWSVLSLRRLADRATTLTSASGLAFSRDIQAEMGIRRTVRFLESDAVELPLTWGIVRPCVVLPADASEWTLERRRYVLQHELAHVRRLDACTQLVGHAAAAIFWFHPLIWYALRRLRHERERACDDCVLARGARASVYAGELLALVSTHGEIDRHHVALAIARRSQFEGRLLALLDPGVDRGLPSRGHVALALGLAAALVVPAAAMHTVDTALTPAPMAAPAPEPAGAPAAPARQAAPATHPAPSTPAPQRAQTTPAVIPSDGLFAGCAAGASSHGSHYNSDNGRTSWTASARVGDCAYDLKSEGNVAFNRDVTGIDRISAGGYFDFTVTIRGDVTRLIARGTDAGAVTYAFSRNGAPADFGPDARAWLARCLVALDRQTAFAVDQRLAPLLADGGPARVLDEVDRMPADHAKATYLIALMDRARLDGAMLRRVCESAAAMSASHDVARVLLEAADRGALQDATARAAYVQAALALEPAHDQAQLLLEFFDRASLTRDQTAAVLARVPDMRVDHDKCRVLMALADTGSLDPSLREAYLNASASIRLDVERTRALRAIGR